MIPPTNPSPSIGIYCFVTIASGQLKKNPTNAPFSQLGMGSCKLNMTKPIANRLMNEAVIALVLSPKVIKNIGMIETVPKIIPAIIPLIMFVMLITFRKNVIIKIIIC